MQLAVRIELSELPVSTGIQNTSSNLLLRLFQEEDIEFTCVPNGMLIEAYISQGWSIGYYY